MKSKPETKAALRWTLPLKLAPLTNKFYAGMHWAKRRDLKKKCMVVLMSQHGRAKAPLPGKPQLCVTRYSSQPCDFDSGYGAKLALDCLKDLGWIVDDSPEHVEVVMHWAPARPRMGELVIEVVTAKRAEEMEEAS